MPMTPFELLDYVGIDIAIHGLDYFAQVLSSDYKPSEAFLSYLKSGRLGKKTGKGFYDWSQGRPQIDLSKASKEYDINHMVALQVNEATRLLEEGVADDPKEIDLAMANGAAVRPLAPSSWRKGSATKCSWKNWRRSIKSSPSTYSRPQRP